MTDKAKNIFIGIIFFIVLILGTAFLIDTLLIDGLGVDKGFLGSILGGAIGTLGVIGTTYFIIEANKKSVEDSIKKQDKQARDRDYTALILTKTEELNQEIIKSTQLYRKIMDILRIKVQLHRLVCSYEGRWSLKNENDGIYDKTKKDLIEVDLKFKILRNEMTVCLNTLMVKNIYIETLSQQIQNYEYSVKQIIESISNDLVNLSENELDEFINLNDKYYNKDLKKLSDDLNDFVGEKLNDLRKGVN